VRRGEEELRTRGGWSRGGMEEEGDEGDGGEEEGVGRGGSELGFRAWRASWRRRSGKAACMQVEGAARTRGDGGSRESKEMGGG
jgi:hypothetical protein